jgi:hypothetical protein
VLEVQEGLENYGVLLFVRSLLLSRRRKLEPTFPLLLSNFPPALLPSFDTTRISSLPPFTLTANVRRRLGQSTNSCAGKQPTSTGSEREERRDSRFRRASELSIFFLGGTGETEGPGGRGENDGKEVAVFVFSTRYEQNASVDGRRTARRCSVFLSLSTPSCLRRVRRCHDEDRRITKKTLFPNFSKDAREGKVVEGKKEGRKRKRRERERRRGGNT